MRRVTGSCSRRVLARFAITPAALAEAHCSSTAALELGIGCLSDLCRAEGLITDLREGAWGRAVDGVGPLAKRFLAFARKERRLVSMPNQLAPDPDQEEEWLWEAQRLHERFPCRALVTSRDLAVSYPDDPVISIERLNLSTWWEARSPSKTVERNTAAYLDALALVLRHANSLMFIDPYIDPLAANYSEFPQLLLAAGANGRKPLIEIHRASLRRVGGQREGQVTAKWMADFQPWSDRLARAGLKADVYLWERMHDRYLISDLVGIVVPNGFDITADAADTSTWVRLGRVERDARQKEFHPASGVHGLAGLFEIGACGPGPC